MRSFKISLSKLAFSITYYMPVEALRMISTTTLLIALRLLTRALHTDGDHGSEDEAHAMALLLWAAGRCPIVRRRLGENLVDNAAQGLPSSSDELSTSTSGGSGRTSW